MARLRLARGDGNVPRGSSELREDVLGRLQRMEAALGTKNAAGASPRPT